MNTPHRQQGLSTISWIVVILVAVFFGVCAVKVLPVYMEGWNVKNTMQKLVDQGDLQGLSSGGIRSKITKMLDVNRIESLKAKDIKITRDKGMTTVDASYEKREELMYNIDVVIKFDDLVYTFPTASRED